MSLEDLFGEGDIKTDNWTRIFARYFGVFYEWLLVPWLAKKSEGEILAGPSLEAESIEIKRPRVRIRIDSKERNLDYDWLLRRDGRLILVEAKCWIAFSNYKKKFEENDFYKKFQSKYEARVRDDFGLHCFLCHEGDFKIIAPPKYKGETIKDKTIDERWLLWWDSDGEETGKACGRDERVFIYSIKDILNKTWKGTEELGQDNFINEAFVQPLEAALDVIKLGAKRALERELEKKKGV